jgi:hypothetical protein
MAKELRRIPFAEFETDPAGVFERVVDEREAVVVEKDNGSAAVLRPLPARKASRRRRVVTDADYAAFLSSAGGWAEVDTEKLKHDIAESRRLSSRPPVEL